MANKIIIDYPPGGLGNFVAQVYTNTVSFDAASPVFHQSKVRKYWPPLSGRPNQVPELLRLIRSNTLIEDVAVCHTHGHSEILADLEGVEIWNVLVVEYFPMLFLNKQAKANADLSILDRIYQRKKAATLWGCLTDLERESFMREYLYDFKLHTRVQPADRYIQFDNFYKSPEDCKMEIEKINHSADSRAISQIFYKSQESLIRRYNNLTVLLEQISNNTSTDLSTLPVLDQAMIAAMLTQKYPQVDWLLAHQQTWFKNTSEISHIINTL